MSAEWINIIVGIVGLILGSCGTLVIQKIIFKISNKKISKITTKQIATNVQGDMVGHDKRIEKRK